MSVLPCRVTSADISSPSYFTTSRGRDLLVFKVKLPPVKCIPFSNEGCSLLCGQVGREKCPQVLGMGCAEQHAVAREQDSVGREMGSEEVCSGCPLWGYHSMGGTAPAIKVPPAWSLGMFKWKLPEIFFFFHQQWFTSLTCRRCWCWQSINTSPIDPHRMSAHTGATEAKPLLDQQGNKSRLHILI